MAIDIPGFNYKLNKYESANTRLPQGFLLGTETVSTVSSRGVYKFPVAFAKMRTYPDNQSSSYDVEFCDWSQVPDDEFAKQDSLDFVTGEFVWTGFDYLGELTPYDESWPSHSSYLVSLIWQDCLKTAIICTGANGILKNLHFILCHTGLFRAGKD